MTPHRCDQCAHVEHLRGVHPMRCRAPDLQCSLPVQVMREDGGRCGPAAALWQPKTQEDRHAER